MRREWSLVAMVLLLVAAPSWADVVYRGDGLTLRLTNDDGTAGTIEKGGRSYPFTASRAAGGISGSFTVDGHPFPFEATIGNDGRIQLHSGGQGYALAREAPAAAGDVAPQSANGPLVLERRPIHDKATNLDVATVLVPRGWVLDDAIEWRPLMTQFVVGLTRLGDPTTGLSIRWFPLDQFNAFPVGFAQAQQQGGSLVSGGMNLCPKPMSVDEYVRQVILPRYCQQYRDVQVGQATELPALERAIAQSHAAEWQAGKQMGREFTLSAARVHLEYTAPNGQPAEADVYCALTYTWTPGMNAQFGQMGFAGAQSVMFYPERIYLLGGPRGRVAAGTPLLQAIVDSYQLTPKWSAFTDNLARQLQQIALNDQAIANAARAEITESQQRSWQDRLASEDRIAEQFRDTIGGQQRFTEPTDGNRQVILPDAYRNAWSDGQGHYILSNDGNYNPRTQPETVSGNWERMGPAR